ncbi:response regulator transcription factor [Nitrosomonas sp.]|uniref:response regulator n=1 Tax=Nitrosomonas sp. TaxID=42353 RepID=UPI00208C5042|nr:response regulator transcription factor [Nitrosomonas sp.]GJL74637.1 MAG: DNA-binding response regulator [Nitrosomonas sp.]
MRLLLIEDDLKIAAFIGKGLKEAGFIIEHTCNGNAGLQMALTSSYDVALIDIMLPGLDGLSIIEQLRQRHIKLPVIILSAKRSIDERVEGLHAGGDDYLTKPFAFSELLARVQALIRRASDTPEPTGIKVGDLSIDLLKHTVIRSGQKITLQPREFCLLEFLARNAGRVVSKTMIMENVWDYNFDPGTNVVESRISRLRDKVDKGFDTHLIHTVRGFGYVLKANE